tara:strand:- start:165 stop:737 length:573 start_codon:yes stop_codon:yes gene_type:complete
MAELSAVQTGPSQEAYKRFREGEFEGFQDLVRHLKIPVSHFLHIHVGSVSVATSLTQKVFCEIYQQGHSYPPTNLGCIHIFRIARRFALDHLFLLDLEEDDTGAPIPEDRFLKCLIERPILPREVVPTFSLKRLRASLQEVPAIFREILFLRLIADFGQRQIAEILDLDLPTVRARLDYALLFLHNTNRG